MSDKLWSDVDDYIAEHLLGADDALLEALAHNVAEGLPPIDVSATQGKMLMLFAQMVGARRILEIGTLGGYSTIWLARALPDDGTLVTLEVDRRHAAVAADNLERAGVAAKVDVIVGPASDSLAAMIAGDPFDLVFIDADKQGNVAYVEQALRLGRPGTTIIVDNVVREGGILETDSSDVRIQGTRRLFDYVASHPRLDATAIQTVGAKKWDGFLLARIID
ncbi:MAG: O-methyltransferase [Sphingorhabdus sp.]